MAQVHAVEHAHGEVRRAEGGEFVGRAEEFHGTGKSNELTACGELLPNPGGCRRQSSTASMTDQIVLQENSKDERESVSTVAVIRANLALTPA